MTASAHCQRSVPAAISASRSLQPPISVPSTNTCGNVGYPDHNDDVFSSDGSDDVDDETFVKARHLFARGGSNLVVGQQRAGGLCVCHGPRSTQQPHTATGGLRLFVVAGSFVGAAVDGVVA